MEFDTIASLGIQGAFIAFLAHFVFTRLIKQVDRLADEVAKLEVLYAKLTIKVSAIDSIESKVNDWNTRLTIVETKLASNH